MKKNVVGIFAPSFEQENQAGRPKERAQSMAGLQGRQKEYEEEVNPFENRFPPSYSRSNLHTRGNEQTGYKRNLS